MGLVINTNIASLIASRNVGRNEGYLQKSISHLSSGLRVATAADDAAGLAISEKLRADTRSYQQAARNSNDGISSMQVAEGALTEVSNILVRMKELAVQAANGTISDHTPLDAEFQQLKSEMVRIGSSTKFNGTSLLQGSYNTTLQVGLTSTETLGIDLSSVDLRTNATAAVKVLTTATMAAAANGVHTGTGTATSGGVYTGAADQTYTITTGATVAASYSAVGSAGTAPPVVTTAGAYTGTAIANYRVEVTTGGASDGTAKFRWSDNGGASWNAVNQTVTNGGGAFALNNGVSVNFANGAYTNDNVYTFTATPATTAVTWTNTSGESGAASSTGAAVTLNNGVTATLSKTGHANNDTYTIAVTGSRNLMTQANAQATMTSVDADIAKVSQNRGTVGSYQNRMEYTVANLQIMAQNSQASESQIRDADFAVEMAQFTKHQVLQQAGVAILSQANQITQSVLSLLK